MWIALKITIGLALLAFVLMRVPVVAALDAARNLTPDVVSMAVLIYFAGTAVNALKLRVMLPSLSIYQAWRFTMIAVLYGTALPGQLAGDAVKAMRLARVAAAVGSVTVAVAVVAVDKLTSLFALLLLTGLGIGLEAGMFGNKVVVAASVVTILSAAAILIALAAPMPQWAGRWGQEFIAWRKVQLSASVLLKSLLLGLVFQALYVAFFAVVGSALGITVSVGAWAVIVGLVSVILLLPVTVAGIGLRDGSLVTLLSLLHQTQGAALALSMTSLAVTLLGASVGFAVELSERDQPLL